MYLHLPDLTDTISYALGPGDTKNEPKTTSRSTHIESKNLGKTRIWSRNGPGWLNLSNESIFLDLACATDTISYVSGLGEAYFDAKTNKTQVKKIIRKLPSHRPGGLYMLSRNQDHTSR